MIYLFAFCIALVLYTYIGYPLLLLLQPRRPTGMPPRGKSSPKVTVIVVVRDAAAIVKLKLASLIRQDYPLDIILVDDGSKDETVIVAQQFATAGKPVRIIETQVPVGKERCQYEALRLCQDSDIIVFTDVNASLKQDAVGCLVSYFDEHLVGAVSTWDSIADAYVQYEMGLRLLESARSGLVGLSGSCFAVRRHLLDSAWDCSAPSDFWIARRCAASGYFAVQSRVPCRYKAPKIGVYSRVRRTTIRGLQGYRMSGDAQWSWNAYLFHHKMLRWVSSFALTLALLPLLPLLAPLMLFESCRRVAACHFAVLDGVVSFIAGDRIYQWEPTKR